MQTVYVQWTREKTYLKVTRQPNDRHNLAIISSDGILSLKADFKKELHAAKACLNDFSIISPPGYARNVGGCGYVAYKEFGDINNAIAFLRKSIVVIDNR